MNVGKLFILSAPSGTGKSTILKKVMNDLEGVAFSISHTTREPRKGEKDGVDYHFIDRSVFMSMKEKGDFLEDANVHGNLYGTSRRGVEEQRAAGLDVILDIDVQGAGIIRESGESEALYIFLAPPSLEELERRLRGRGLDDDETIITRLKNARREMQAINEFEYVIINEKIDEAARMFEAVILAQRSRDRRHITGSPLPYTTWCS
ncbi:guanylate kinase [Desulfopila inferna]|uniref:guanylate kinase n=1 Tax=Desulfopila inferna TaxID=468528 RepID=UPI00196688DF|nr:guanylate kinase [Desulfopila inferna]MBM9605227.1 guanylate kinase [Desulfopila inferna]